MAFRKEKGREGVTWALGLEGKGRDCIGGDIMGLGKGFSSNDHVCLHGVGESIWAGRKWDSSWPRYGDFFCDSHEIQIEMSVW